MSDSKTKKITEEDLKQFNGQNNNPLYVVFKGKVYDLTASKLWTGGKHMGMHTLNDDLAEAIKGAPHGEDNVYRYPVIGEFTKTSQTPMAPTSEIKQIIPQISRGNENEPGNMDRRTFLKLAAAAGGAITIAALLSAIKAGTFVPAATISNTWPIVTVANINKLVNLEPVVFYYPLTNTPNYLVKLGVQATGGIGPEKDIVAFSAICQHLGCEYGFVPPEGSPVCNSSYKASIPTGYCCCHGSQYDFVDGAKVIGGPAPRPVPMVMLQLDTSTGDISAVGMQGPTIFGHGPPGTSDPKLVLQYDLQGGELVTQATVMG